MKRSGSVVHRRHSGQEREDDAPQRTRGVDVRAELMRDGHCALPSGLECLVFVPLINTTTACPHPRRTAEGLLTKVALLSVATLRHIEEGYRYGYRG